MPRQSGKSKEALPESELHSQAPSAAAPAAHESSSTGGPLIQLASAPVADLGGASSGAGAPLLPQAAPAAATPSAAGARASTAASSVSSVQSATPQAPPADSAASSSPKAATQATTKAAGQASEAAKLPKPEVDMERTAAIFRQLRMQLTPATRHATINLVPADLGRIVIHLTVRGGKVTGDIRADKEETLKILEAHAPELRAALEQNGFETTDFNLSRHGDPSSGRSSEANFPLSETIGRKRSGVPEGAPEQVLSILREDCVDTLA